MRTSFACRLIAMLVVSATASPALAQEARKIPAKLQGHWKLTILGFEGREIKLRNNMPHWVIKGDQIQFGGEPFAKLMVDEATMPPILDVCYVNSKRVYEAVYAVEGDQLKICVNQRTQGVKERPLDFATKDHSERRLLIFERQDPAGGDGSAGSPGYIGIDFGVKPKSKKGKEKTLFITDVTLNGPGQKAGLKKDDIIVKIGATEPSSPREAFDEVRQLRPGADLTVRVRRGTKEQDIRVGVRVVPFFFLDD
jgi:uncharacterized protein (TIGR03067 family)